ncbi:MAG: TIGR03086 family metal-binding protein [Aeromicrobium sp.]
MDEISEKYRRRADLFEAKVTAVQPDQWSNQSPCDEWTARDVVGHIIDMHGVMLRPLGRALSPAPALADDPLGAWKAARADIDRLLDDPESATREVDTPVGRMTAKQHVDEVASIDLVLHGWDLARATGQDDTIDPQEVVALWPALRDLPEKMYTPNAFGPGIVVFGPKVDLPEDAPLQDRLLGAIGRDPDFRP